MTTKTWRARSLVAAGCLALVLAVGAVPAGAGTQRTPIVDPTSVAPGGAFTVSGPADCTQEGTVTVTVAGLSLSQTVSGALPWSLDFVAPADAEPGTYLVTVDGECNFGDSNLIITAVTPTTAAPTPTTAVPVAAAAAATAAPAFTG